MLLPMPHQAAHRQRLCHPLQFELLGPIIPATKRASRFSSRQTAQPDGARSTRRQPTLRAMTLPGCQQPLRTTSKSARPTRPAIVRLPALLMRQLMTWHQLRPAHHQRPRYQVRLFAWRGLITARTKPVCAWKCRLMAQPAGPRPGPQRPTRRPKISRGSRRGLLIISACLRSMERAIVRRRRPWMPPRRPKPATSRGNINCCYRRGFNHTEAQSSQRKKSYCLCVLCASVVINPRSYLGA